MEGQHGYVFKSKTSITFYAYNLRVWNVEINITNLYDFYDGI